MKNAVLIIFTVFVIILFFSCKKDFNNASVSSNNSIVSNYTSTTKGQKFGALVNAAHRYETDTYTAQTYTLADTSKLKLLKSYGVKYVRLEITHDSEWIVSSTQAKFLTSYRLFYDSGFAVLLNVKYKSPAAGPNPFPDSAAYRSFLKQVLDSLAAKKPAMVYVENEETNPGYFTFTSKAQFEQYFPVLNGAAAECHGRSIPVTNGGIVANALCFLTWDWLKGRHMGDTALTNGFIRKAFAPTMAAQVIAGTYNSSVNLFKQVIPDYVSSGIDDVNMHWYEPVILRSWNDTNDGSSAGVNQDAMAPGVFDSVVTYLDATFSVPVLTNEIGQLTSSGTLTGVMMDKLLSYQALGSNLFPVACWYDGDGSDEYTAYALHNAYKNALGKYTFSLRSTGTTFQMKLQ